MSAFEGLAFTKRLDLLLEREQFLRENRKQDRLIQQAQYKLQSSVQQIDYGHGRNINKDVVARLARCDWNERQQNLIFNGPCDTTAKHSSYARLDKLLEHLSKLIGRLGT